MADLSAVVLAKAEWGILLLLVLCFRMAGKADGAIVWRETFDDVGKWGVYQSAWTAHSNSSATLMESGASVWGKSWTQVGWVDVSSSKWLYVKVDDLSGTVKIAVSGPSDSYYREYVTSSVPGQFVADLSGWSGNGTNLYVQLIVEGEGARAIFEDAYLADAPSYVRYVARSCTNPIPPFMSWKTAATNIQDAVDAAGTGDVIWVTNGVYNSGGRPRAGQVLTNRVLIDKPICLRSVNGPEVTVIVGQGSLGSNCVRGVYMTNTASLSGFTITNGCTRAAYYDYYYGSWASDQESGGGVFGGNVSNCILVGNQASAGGGAAYALLYRCLIKDNMAGGGSVCAPMMDPYFPEYGYTQAIPSPGGGGACNCALYSCVMVRNTATVGGGAYESTLDNCTVMENAASGVEQWCYQSGYFSGGGLFGGSAYNSIVVSNSIGLQPMGYSFYYYSGDDFSNVQWSSVSYSCLNANPQFVDAELGDYRLRSNSPCLNAGSNLTWMFGGQDFDGNRRIARAGWPVDIGAYEYVYAPAPEFVIKTTNGAILQNEALPSGPNGTDYGPVLIGRTITNWLTVSNAGAFPVTMTWTTNGIGYRIRHLPSALAVGQTTNISIEFLCTAFYEYTGNVVMAHNASNFASPFVINLWGLGRPSTNAYTFYVVKTNAWAEMPYTNWQMGAESIQRAIDFSLAGDTLVVTNGVYDNSGKVGYPAGGLLTNRVAIYKAVAIRSLNGPSNTVIAGRKDPVSTNGSAAVRCVYMVSGASLSGFSLTNGATSVAAGDISGNRSGGGIWCVNSGAVISNCILRGNSADEGGGGAYDGSFYDCTFIGNTADRGGGSYHGLLRNCALTGNQGYLGGGSYYSTLYDCSFAGNCATNGGGSYYGTLRNCTFTGNRAANGGGSYYGTLYNGVFNNNTATNGGGAFGGTVFDGVFNGNSAVNGGAAYGGSLTNGVITGNLAGNSGGGVYGGTHSACILTRNSAVQSGGGAQQAWLRDCVVTSNSALRGGGAADSTLTNCTLTGNTATNGGGVAGGAIYNSALFGNSAVQSGGGGYGAWLRNCAVVSNSAARGGGIHSATGHACRLEGNSAWVNGGGAGYSELYSSILFGNRELGGGGGGGGGACSSGVYNCTLVGNTAVEGGGGADGCALRNSILYFNVSAGASNWQGGSLVNCCTLPASGADTFTADPQFLNLEEGDFHIQSFSPCRDAGFFMAWQTNAVDLEGHPRIANAVVDIGAYEIPFALYLRAMLQGPYDMNTHGMTAILGAALPKTAPYLADHRTVSAVPAGAVDWILLEIRDAASRQAVAAQSAFINQRGYLIGDNGRTGVAVSISSATNGYFLAVKHRNHPAVMTGQPIVFTNDAIIYDFTAGSEKVYGGTNGTVQLESGVWGMLAGDADGDGKITPTDQAIVERQVGMSGYVSGDLNLNGVVDE